MLRYPASILGSQFSDRVISAFYPDVRQIFKSLSEIIRFKTHAELKILNFFHQNFRDIEGKQVLWDCDSNEAYLLFLLKFGKNVYLDNIQISQNHYFCTKFELISSANQPLSNLIKPRNQGS